MEEIIKSIRRTEGGKTMELVRMGEAGEEEDG